MTASLHSAGFARTARHSSPLPPPAEPSSLGGLATTIKIGNRKALRCKASAEGAPVVRHLIQARQQNFILQIILRRSGSNYWDAFSKYPYLPLCWVLTPFSRFSSQ